MIKSALYYSVVCDNHPDRSAQDAGDYTAWAQVFAAIQEAEDGDWSIRGDGEAHHCPDCPRWCVKANCLNLAGEDPEDERDGECPSCWAKR